MERYIERALEPVLTKAAQEFPALLLTGPRQSGKTTLLQHLFGRDYEYVSLQLPHVRAAAQEDPRTFLARFSPPVIYDEIQFAPELLSYVKEHIDANRAQPGQFILTGSQNLLLMATVSESLAGRTAVFRLLPLSMREAKGRPRAPFLWETKDTGAHEPHVIPEDFWKEVLRGSYPELVASPHRSLELWHSAYVQTYLERDVRTLRQVGDLTQFQSFLRALAARTAQLLNLSELARDLGVAVNTAKAWLSVLEATHQVMILRPYFANIGKRLVKTPKIYFTDPGTLCHLTGLSDPEHAARGPLAGQILETVVVGEIVKTFWNRGKKPEIYFWRTSAGEEVDFLIKDGEALIPIEVKLSATPRPAMASSIRRLQEALGPAVSHGYVVHPGGGTLPLGAGVTAAGLQHL